MFKNKVFAYLTSFVILLSAFFVLGSDAQAQTAAAGTTLTTTVKIDQTALGFQIPNLADILTFIIRAFFVIAGLIALFYLLLGALEFVTSGGDEEKTGAARKKITSAVIGVILIVVVLAVIVTLEQIIFQGKICVGISCAATIPALVKPCCAANQAAGTNGCVVCTP